MSPPASASRLPMAVAWGLFLASSWTWCIGMFLPVLLLRDFGWAGFVAFAIPNVLGCAAFGYVLTRGGSERFVARHPWLTGAFSAVTVAYHLFFAGFAATRLTPPEHAAAPGTALLLAILLFVGGMLLARLRGAAWPWLGALLCLASLIAFAALGVAGLDAFGWRGAAPPAALPWLVPTLLFGFLLCPYLDLTFHRALRESPSRHSFAVFGVAFSAMLLFTAAYAALAPDGLPLLVLAHLAWQALFTVAVHLRELRLLPWTGAGRLAAGLLWIGATALGVWGIGSAPAGGEGMETVRFAGAAEAMYLRFLVFYGLVFPACLAVLASGRVPAPTRVKVALAVVIAASLPCYELGFLQYRTWLLVPPLAAVAALVAWRRASAARAAQA